MSLQIWLPLNGDLHNQGIANVNVTNNSAVIDNNGKIGKCYSFGTGSSYLTIDSDILKNYTEFSFACWVNIISWNSAYATIFAVKNSTGVSWNNLIFSLLRNSSTSTLCFSISNGTNYTSTNCSTGALSTGVWYHFVCTYKAGIIKLYQNGVLVKSYSTNIVPAFSSIANLWIGRANSNSYQTNIKLNDVRIYNHCLSQQQIKEISKGLILHYPLNRNGWKVASNLLLNGFGELGTTNWSSSSGIYTDDLPTEDNSIKARFYNVTSLDYIPIYRNHTYKYSCYIKASSTSGTVYPSLFPYDRDKNMISTQHTKEGFNLNTMTTLTQQLKSGDTKIYVENLSTWNSNSGNYYNYAAIFGYKDSLGNTYPDGVYTRTVPAFGTSTNAKTNLDKINNIITLNKAYSGATIPIGTHICQSTAGSTYFYPLGGIANSTIQNWTYKEKTFSSEHPRLVAAKYVTVYTYTGSTQAGITLEDLTINDNIEYDISGYQNNGTKYNITYETDAPKYNVSSVFKSTNTSYIKVNDNKWMPQYQEAMTINLWAYSSNWSNTTKLFSCTESGGWNTEGGNSGYIRFPIYVATNSAQTSYAYKYNSQELKISDLSAGWHMLTFIYDSTGNKVYVDGQLHSSYAFTSYGIRYNTNARLFLGCEANTASPYTPYFNGKLSDFRIYTTALSAEDVLSLYNNGAYIDQLNEIHGKVR